MMNVSHQPRVRTESALHATFDRSLAKSDEQARAGTLPRLIRQGAGYAVWSVSSRTVGGSVYLVEAALNGDTGCDCQAAGWCWHRTHVERAQAGHIGAFVLAHPTPLPAISAAMLAGKREVA